MQISILGGGWLGTPLAEELQKKDHRIKVSTTSSEKLEDFSRKGFQPFLFKLDPEAESSVLADFMDSDLLLINIPPGTRKNPDSDFHIRQMNFLLRMIKNSTLKKVIYISSTSVYPDSNSVMKEDDIKEKSEAGNTVLFEAEELVKASGKQYCILRMGGLTGYDRNLVKFFEGKKNLKGGNTPVNMIHRDDCIKIISQLIESDAECWNQTYNCCSPIHPSRKEFYTELAVRFHRPIPEYEENDNTDWKEISSEKMIERLGYNYIFKNPMDYTYF